MYTSYTTAPSFVNSSLVWASLSGKSRSSSARSVQRSAAAASVYSSVTAAGSTIAWRTATIRSRSCANAGTLSGSAVSASLPARRGGGG